MFGLSDDQLLTLVIGLVGGAVVTVLTPYLSRRKFRILYDFDCDAVARDANFDGLRYEYKGHQVSSIYETELFIRSFGNTVIEPNILSNSIGLEFFVCHGRILDAILFSGQSHSDASILVSEDRKSLTVKIDRIAPGDNFFVHMVSEENPMYSLESKSYILGKPRAVRKSKEIIASGFPVFIALFFLFMPLVWVTSPFGNESDINTWWFTASVILTIFVGYGGAALAAFEYFLGARAKMRRLKKAERTHQVDIYSIA